MNDIFENKSVLITGGTGSLGKYFTRYILTHFNPHRVVIFSRDEYKQSMMKQEFAQYGDKLRFFIGDVRDKDRLLRAFDRVQIVIHAAAIKQVPTCEYNPIEAIRTNINGAMNVIDAAIDRKVECVVALSTDKAVNPVNLYGGTKLVSDKLFVAANAYAKISGTKFSVVRYGNVAGSRGSVIPFFEKLMAEGKTTLPVTDVRMTRFWIDLEQGVKLILKALYTAVGGEVFVSKIPSFKVTDLVKAMNPDGSIEEVGIREGEKLHEVMITDVDSRRTVELEDCYVIMPEFSWYKPNEEIKAGKKLPDEFVYSSDKNTSWLSVEQLQEKLKLYRQK